ncbi:MAG: 3'-phosphoesterase [Deltaproteobacteria bacterium]|nr:3'-phosphoesterase [Deltaproteobacteria bacterium]
MSGTRLNFCIQKHRTEHPHYNLRLEIGGILRSWILPKTIPTKDNEMRLVIEDKEDPHGSVNSKGIVEDGYGEGEVEIWDSGTYKLAKNSKSKIEIEVKSEKLSGKFVLLLPNWGRWYKKRLWILIKL